MFEVLRTEKLCKRSGDAMLVDQMHLYVMKGEILGIIGLYDSGRSALAKVLAGIWPATSGEIYVEGKRVEIRKIHEAHASGIFCVRNQTTLIPDLTVMENMCLLNTGVSNNLCFPDQTVVDKAKKLLEIMDIHVNLRAKCRDLSSFDLHRIEICRAFFCCVKVLIIDDIFSRYTQREQECMQKLLHGLKGHDVAIVLMGSRAEQLVPVCDRIIMMRNGRDVGMYFKGEFSVPVIERALTGQENSEKVMHVVPYGGVPVFSAEKIVSRTLTDFSLSIYPGEVAGIVDIQDRIAEDVAGLFNENEPPVSGKVTIDGKAYEDAKSIQWAFRNCIGYVDSYKKSIFPQLTFLENLTIASLENYSKGFHISKRLERFAASEYLKNFGVSQSILEERISSQNRLLQMKAALHRWMLKNVKVLVMNDVFDQTDIVMRNCIDEFIRFAQQKGMGIILLSANNADLRRVCTTKYELREGEIVGK